MSEQADKPIFGELMPLIHPYDFYELSDGKAHITQVGTTGLSLSG